MKINKDLAEAFLMLAIIILVLAATSEFENPTTKTITMIGLGVFAVISGIFRILGARQKEEE